MKVMSCVPLLPEARMLQHRSLEYRHYSEDQRTNENMSWLPDDLEFQFDGRPYLYEPEYTDEQLQDLEERERREREELVEAEESLPDRRAGNWWCSCWHCEVMATNQECLCCRDWDHISSLLNLVLFDSKINLFGL